MLGTIAGWRTYASERGSTAPTYAADDLATAALVRASDHILYSYVASFLPGYDETLPIVTLAAYEAALLELATPGFFSATYTPSQQKVLTEVKGIRWTMKDASTDVDRDEAVPVSTKVEAMLRPYLARKFRIGLSAVG
jgi:hypothetical protein